MILIRFEAPEPFVPKFLMIYLFSPWLGMNILPINSKLCMVEEHQTMLMKELKRFGIELVIGQ